MEKLVSKRAEVARDWEDFLFKYLNLCTDDPYEEKKNPKGYVNLGTAVNSLCSDLILPKLTSKDVWHCDKYLLDYNTTYGILRLREAIAKTITEFFETPEPISPKNLFCLTGVTSCLDMLAHCLGDPGDVFLVPTPAYGRILTDFKQRSLCEMWPIPIITENNTEDFPVLTIEKVIKAYENARSENKVVCGLLLINPNNPLGDVYSPELLMDIMSFCQALSLHIIVDEIYALSVFSQDKFHSILKFQKLPNPDRTHVLYGLSKDFGVAGLRIGVIHTKCEPLQKCLRQLSSFQNIPFPLMEIAAKYIEDLDWCRKYIKINQQRLSETCDFCVKRLQGIGLKVRDSSAGFFLWLDLRHFCKSFDQEREFFNYLIEEFHMYICPGEEFLCAQPGWFRLAFSVNPIVLREGLDRLAKAVKEYAPLNT